MKGWGEYNAKLQFMDAAYFSANYMILQRCGKHPRYSIYESDFFCVRDFSSPKAKGEYNAYIYAYDREMLDAFLEPDQKIAQEGPITVLVVPPGDYPYVKAIDPGLKSLQSEVDGWIEAVYPFEDQVAIICNEEGKLNCMTPNRALYDEDGRLYDVVAGQFLVVGLTEDNFGSLTDEQIKKYSDRFHTPEGFMRLGGQIIVIPIWLFQLIST